MTKATPPPLAANTGSINFRQSGPLIAGTVDVAGIATTNTTRIEATGPAANLTLNNAVTAGAAGDAVIPKAGSVDAAGVSIGGQLINNVDAGDIVASSGHYLASTFVHRIAPTLAVTANAGNKVYDGAAPTLIFGTKAKR